MVPDLHFADEIAFEPAHSAEQLRSLPEAPGVLALFGPAPRDGEPRAQPFLTRTANLRRRAQRLLQPPPPREQLTTPEGGTLPSRRLNLRDRVARVAWTATGSEFESLLTLYHVTAAVLGLPEARRRLKLHTPFFVRFAAENAFPRVYVTNRLSSRALADTFGPFPSRLAAERYADAVLDLFKLRRCWEDLAPYPDHPGCAYGEMRKCLAPCNLSCTPEVYAAESHAVAQFFRTRGASLLQVIAAERDRASDEMDFEAAAERHRQHEKAKAAAALADDLVAPVSALRALIVQHAGPPPHGTEEHPEQAAVFLLEHGALVGPSRLSTLGVRAVREQTSVGSSLFAQPLMLAAVPLPPEPPASQAADVQPQPDDFASTHGITPMLAPLPPHSPEERARAVLHQLKEESRARPLNPALLSDHLALLRRWYYRPEKQRSGELLQPNADGSWPVRRLLNAAARAALGDPRTMQTTDREGARAARTKLLHAGREGVERSVPDLGPTIPRAPRHVPALGETNNQPVGKPAFRSRRTRSRQGVVTPAALTPDAAPTVSPTGPADKLSPP